MTDKKLTTESIVQGLDGADVFLRDLAGSTHTSLNEYDIGILFNIAHLCGDAADFVNRQKAEIERLQRRNFELEIELKAMRGAANSYKAEVERLETECDKQYEIAEANVRAEIASGGTSCHWCEDKVRAEATKEFAEMLKDKLGNTDLAIRFIDNLVKEMVGEDSNAPIVDNQK